MFLEGRICFFPLHLSERVQMLLLLLQIPLALLNELIYSGRRGWRYWRWSNHRHRWRGDINHIFCTRVVYFCTNKQTSKNRTECSVLKTKCFFCIAAADDNMMAMNIINKSWREKKKNTANLPIWFSEEEIKHGLNEMFQVEEWTQFKTCDQYQHIPSWYCWLLQKQLVRWGNLLASPQTQAGLLD